MASPLIQNIFSNVYKDDFRDSANYHRILFNSGRAVQARELTQMQTIIQREMERFGNNIFKDGAAVNPVQNVYINNKFDFVKIQNTGLTASAIIGFTLTGATSGAVAKVVDYIAPEDGDPATLYVTYSSGGGINGDSRFRTGETLTGGPISIYVQSTNTTDNPSIGYATKASVQTGAFFVKGHFVQSNPQSIIVSKYSSTPTEIVGFRVTETAHTVLDDTTLYDNSQDNYNLTAPGADRYKISLDLVTQTEAAANDWDFVFLANIVGGDVVQINDGADGYNRILDVMAQRTKEESGNYTVRPFTSFFQEDSANTHLILNVAGGVGYVNGYRASPGPNKIRVPKPTDTEVRADEAISATYGNWIEVDTMLGDSGFPDVTNLTTVNLRSATTHGGSTIGTARVRSVEPVGSNYKVYLFDIQMNTSQDFRSTRSIGTSTTNYADVVLQNGNAVLEGIQDANLFFPLPYTRPESIEAAAAYYTYSTLRNFTATTTSGNATISANAGETFDNTNSWIVFDDTTGAVISSPTITLTGSPVGNSADISAGNGSNGIRVVAILQKGGSGDGNAYKTKTLTNTTVTSTVTSDSEGTWISLENADIYNVTRITAVDSDGPDLSSRFYLDNGQRDNFYGVGKIRLNPGQVAPVTDVFVRFNHFAHSGDGDFFCVSSYPVGTGSGQILYSEIPSYRQTNGERVELRDVLDFRPRKDNTNANFTGTGSSSSEIPPNTDLITVTPTYYLPRRDALVLQDNGDLAYLTGTSNFNPQYPKIPDNSMQLYSFQLEPNTLNPKDLQSRHYDNRRYTMRDIGKLHHKINKVEELATLSLLDLEASTLEVLDGSGNPRTKAGFLTDDFKDHRASNVDDLEFRASIDPTQGIMRPGYRQKNVPLIIDSDASLLANTVLRSDYILLDYTSTLMLEQPIASRIQNINPFTVINYNGTLIMSPSGDEAGDNDSIRLRVDGRDEIGIETFLNNILGQDDTREVLRQLENNPEFGGRAAFVRQRISLNDANNFTSAGSLEDAISTLPPNTSQILASVFDNINPTWREYAWGWAGIESRETEEQLLNGGIPTTSESTFGRFATRLFIPRIRSREVRFHAKGLKPNTIHYPFFDGIRVDSYVVQLSRLGLNAQYWDHERWWWSNRRTWVWPGWDSRLFFRRRWWRWHPYWQDTQPSVTQRRLVSDENGEIKGSFMIPNNNEDVFFAGERTFSLYDNTEEDLLNSTSRASTVYTVEGTNSVRIEGNRTAGGRSSYGLGLFLIFAFDPVAQAFRVENPSGAYITKIRVYFQSKDTVNNIPVDCEIRPMVNGYPAAEEIVEGGFKQLQASEVNVSDDASAATDFVFDVPVYLEGNKEYAFVLRAATDAYNVWTAKMGDFILGRTDKKVSKQPSLGAFFVSSNGTTWNGIHDQDITFQIERAEFETSGSVIMHNDVIVPKLIPENPFLFDSGSDIVRVIHPNHGLQVGDDISFPGVDSSLSYPLSNASVLAGMFDVKKVDNTGYHIQISENATGNARSGGSNVQAPDNAVMDEMYPSIEVFTPSKTNTSMQGKFTYGLSLAGASGSEGHGTTYNLEADYTHNLVPFEAYKFDAPRVIVSEKLEEDIEHPDNTAFIKVNLTTTSDWVSPIVSASRASITTISNIIDNQDSADDVSPFNNPLSFISETDPFGGTSAAKYVTKPVTIEEPAKGLKVILSANRPKAASFDLYYKIVSGDGNLNETAWVYQDPDTEVPFDEDPTKFREYRYTIGGVGGTLDEFTTFQIKIVMNSSNSSRVPVFKDFRAIALTV